MSALYERYRPQTFEQFIGQEKAIERVRRIIDRPGFNGDSFWIVGPSGTGKTSLAWIIARQFADSLDIIELDGEACTIDAVRKAADTMHYTTLSGCAASSSAVSRIIATALHVRLRTIIAASIGCFPLASA